MVDAVSAAGQLQAQTAGSSQTLSDNFDTFLLLLTTQLQNQDPLEPVDSTEFTNQLVQFSGVEQQIATNEGLADLITIMAANQSASLAGYLGKDVVLNSPVAEYSGTPINWRYQLGQDLSEVTISVQAANGDIVYSEDGETGAGFQDFIWDGSTQDGSTAANGVYSLIVNGVDANGNNVQIPIGVTARVTGIDLSTGETGIATTAGLFGYSQILSFAEPG